jgi:hypothetical protein
MAIVSAEVRFAPQLTAWFTANPTKVLQDGEIVYCSDGANIGKYVIGDNVTTLNNLVFYGGISSSGALTIGSTSITSGTNTRILYNNAGVVGEYLVTGTGTTAVLSTSPDFTTGATIGGVAIPTISSTNTFTNKRITARVTTITSSATPTINTDDCDAVTITALATAITSLTTNLSGTPTDFQKLIIRIKDNGTARAITWGASFVAKGVALPTTTVISKLLTVGFIYDTVAASWGCVASAQEA